MTTSFPPGLVERLHAGLDALQLSLPAALPQQVLQYLALLLKWNRAYNLTAVRDPQEMIPRHVLDSLVVLPYVCGPAVLDVGTGAGLPGLLLALARPDWQFSLLDSNAKKTRFITQVVIELGLSNVSVVCQRAEHWQTPQRFDSILSRAYSDLETFYQQTRSLCAADGCLLALKGKLPEEELNALQKRGLQPTIQVLNVPGLHETRHLIKLSPGYCSAACQ